MTGGGEGTAAVVHSTRVASLATHGIMRHTDGAPNHMAPPMAQTNLAELLRRLRQEAGLSLYELARRSGINRSIVARIEDGTTTQPDVSTLNRIARTLGVEPELLYDALWEDSNRPLPSPATYFRSKYQLSEDQIRQLERSMRELTNQPEDSQDNERKAPRPR